MSKPDEVTEVGVEVRPGEGEPAMSTLKGAQEPAQDNTEPKAEGKGGDTVFPKPTQVPEPGISWRDGVVPWSEEKIESLKLQVKRWMYGLWLRDLKPRPCFPQKS